MEFISKSYGLGVPEFWSWCLKVEQLESEGYGVGVKEL